MKNADSNNTYESDDDKAGKWLLASVVLGTIALTVRMVGFICSAGVTSATGIVLSVFSIIVLSVLTGMITLAIKDSKELGI